MNEDRLTPWRPGSVLIGRGSSTASQMLTGLAAIKANAAITKMICNGTGVSPFIMGDRYARANPEFFDPTGRLTRIEDLRSRFWLQECAWKIGGFTGPRNFGGPIGGSFYDGGFVRGPEE